MSDCSNHKKEVAGITDMKLLAEMIGDLHYETLAVLFLELAKKLDKDSVNDWDKGHTKLSIVLKTAVNNLEFAHYSIYEAWYISKPFMNKDKQ